MRSLPLKPFVLLCAITLAAAACSKSTPSAAGTPTTATSSPTATASSSSSATPATLTIDGRTANNKGTEDLAGKSTFTLELDNEYNLFYFEPTVLVGTPGEKVTLVLKNEGNTKHNFTLDAQKINQDVNTPGSSAKVTITFPQAGTLEFHCEYHQAIGMIGELRVSS
jgi:plastocyanin